MQIFVVPRVLEDPNDWRKVVVQVGDYGKTRKSGFTFIQGGRPRLMLNEDFVWFDSEVSALQHLWLVANTMRDELMQLYAKWTAAAALAQATIDSKREALTHAWTSLQQPVEGEDKT